MTLQAHKPRSQARKHCTILQARQPFDLAA